MVAGATLSIDNEAIARIQGFVEGLSGFAFDTLEQTIGDVEPELLATLQATPGPVRYPIAWTSEKQRRAFFASNGFGRGIPTRRTGAVQAGWQTHLERQPGQLTYTLENTVPHAKWVYGTLNRKRATAIEPQQAFHRNTGWQVATDTTTPAMDRIVDTFAASIDKQVELEFERL